MPVLTSNSITRPKSSVVTANLPLGAKVMVLPWRRKSGRPYLKSRGRKGETKQRWQEIKRNCSQETNTGTCTRSFDSHNTHNVLIPRDHDLVSPNLSQRKHMDVLRELIAVLAKRIKINYTSTRYLAERSVPFSTFGFTGLAVSGGWLACLLPQPNQPLKWWKDWNEIWQWKQCISKHWPQRWINLSNLRWINLSGVPHSPCSWEFW